MNRPMTPEERAIYGDTTLSDGFAAGEAMTLRSPEEVKATAEAERRRQAAFAAHVDDGYSPRERDVRETAATVINELPGGAGVNRFLGVRPPPPSFPTAPGEKPVKDNGVQGPAGPGLAWGEDEPPPKVRKVKGNGGVARGPLQVGDIGFQGQTPTYSPEAEKEQREAFRLAKEANTFAMRAQEESDRERHAAEALIGTNQAAYDREAKRLEEKRVAEYNAFQDRIEAKKEEARAQAPGRAISSLFSAVAIGMGAYASSITKTPNVALDLFKHAADEEARRLERESRNENNYYHRMLQEFGDKKQALAMTKIGFLEQGKLALEKAAANSKSAHAKETLMRGAAATRETAAKFEQDLHNQREPPKMVTGHRGLYAGEDPGGVAAVTAGMAKSADAALAKPPAPAAPGPKPPPAMPAGERPPLPGSASEALARLKGLWESPEKKAAEGALGAASNLTKRFGGLFHADEAPARKASARAAAPLLISKLPGWSAPPGKPAEVPGEPVKLAPDGLPIASYAVRIHAEKQVKDFTSKHSQEIEDMSNLVEFDNVWGNVGKWPPEALKRYQETADRVDRMYAAAAEYKGGAGEAMKKGVVGVLAGPAVLSMHGDSAEKRKQDADAFMAAQPSQFQRMYALAKTARTIHGHKYFGSAVTAVEAPRHQQSGLDTNHPLALKNAVDALIRGPRVRVWQTKIAAFAPLTQRMLNHSVHLGNSASSGLAGTGGSNLTQAPAARSSDTGTLEAPTRDVDGKDDGGEDD